MTQRATILGIKGKLLKEVSAGDQGLDPAVGHHMPHPVIRIVRLYRQKRAAGLEDPQHGDQEVDAAFRQDAHKVIPAHPHVAQPGGHAVGLLIQLGIADLSAPMDGRGPVRRRRGLSLEDLMQRQMERVVVSCCVVEGVDQQSSFRVGKYLKAGHRLFWGLQQMAERGLKMGCDPPHLLFRMKLAIEAEGHLNRITGCDGDVEVVVGPVMYGDRRGGDIFRRGLIRAGQRILCRIILKDEHMVEQIPAHEALRLHLRERAIMMRLTLQRCPLHGLQNLQEGLVRLKLDSHGNRVDEEAHHLLHPPQCRGPSGDNRTEHHIFNPVVSRQEHSPQGLDDCVEGHAVSGGELFQRHRPFKANRHLAPVPELVEGRLPGLVEGHLPGLVEGHLPGLVEGHLPGQRGQLLIS